MISDPETPICSLCPNTCLVLLVPSSSSLHQVRARCILQRPHSQPKKSLPRSQVKCKSKKKEENISLAGNLPVNIPDTKVSMELFPSEPAKMSLADGKSKNKRVLHKQLKDVENEKQQRM